MSNLIDKAEFDRIVLKAQQEEITGFHIYKRLAAIEKDEANKNVLARIAGEELDHYNFFKGISGKEVKPKNSRVNFFVLMAKVLGLTFAIKLMEKQEVNAQSIYEQLIPHLPQIKDIMESEEAHEKELIDMIKEERLDYIGSIVLGLNDALVELTGALAGFSLALQNTKLIAIVGLITGIAASLSMAASQYLSVKTDGEKNAGKSALYTGIAYVLTVAVLITPFLLLTSYFVALGVALFSAVLIIFLFNYYISVAKDLNFKHRFLEMTIISLGVSALTFGIGLLIRNYFGIDI